MKIIATIEDCDIVEQADGSVTWTAKMAIDGDGVGPSHGDPDYQNHTSLKPDLNADVDQYIVVPPAIIKGVVGIVLGCAGTVKNQINGLICDVVVGDVGPHNKLGEASIATAKALGVPASPTSGGNASHVFEYTIRPGVPAIVNGKTYALQPS